MARPAIIVHGGAGRGRKDFLKNAGKVVDEAADKGLKSMKRGRTPLDAVEKAVNVLEDSSQFNAGLGSDSQSDGKVRMDASVMDSKMLCGAVASVENIRNPVSAARKVAEKTVHVLMVGPAASRFAVRHGVRRARIPPRNTQRGVRDTVGAVAVDSRGEIAAASSTSGGMKPLPGRVGDVPIIGSGIYVTKRVGAVMTGDGEAFMKSLALRHVTHPEDARSGLRERVDRCLREVGRAARTPRHRRKGGEGGVIAMDRRGGYCARHTSRHMPWVHKSL